MRSPKTNILSQQLEKILTELPDTRNSDVALTIELWKRFYSESIEARAGGSGLCIPLTNLYIVPSQDNVKRERAKFNENGMFYPTEWAVARRRGIAQDAWREANGYPKENETMNPTKNPSYFNSKSFNNNYQIHPQDCGAGKKCYHRVQFGYCECPKLWSGVSMIINTLVAATTSPQLGMF